QLLRADLRAADLSEAQLSDADLRGADLRGAQLRRTVMWRARFEMCPMSRSQIVESDVRAACFDHADLRFSAIEHCHLGNARFVDAQLDGVSLHGSVEDATDYRGASMSAVSRTDPKRAKAERFEPPRRGPSS
ncbi:partial Secreted effector protein PipB2, partial [Anaerolineae bacterium]